MASIISGMSAIVWVTVVAVFVMAAKRMKNLPGKTRVKDSSYASADKIYSSARPEVRKVNKAPRNLKSRAGASNTADGMILCDDRNNDWLAKQLREEVKARARMSDMFQMKIEHANKCDAEFIRRFHESECDANGIDIGERNR